MECPYSSNYLTDDASQMFVELTKFPVTILKVFSRSRTQTFENCIDLLIPPTMIRDPLSNYMLLVACPQASGQRPSF
jgi:hypothetical protein